MSWDNRMMHDRLCVVSHRGCVVSHRDCVVSHRGDCFVMQGNLFMHNGFTFVVSSGSSSVVFNWLNNFMCLLSKKPLVHFFRHLHILSYLLLLRLLMIDWLSWCLDVSNLRLRLDSVRISGHLDILSTSVWAGVDWLLLHILWLFLIDVGCHQLGSCSDVSWLLAIDNLLLCLVYIVRLGQVIPIFLHLLFSG